jgi:hypothetical protein
MSQRRLLVFVSSRMAELTPERGIVKAELDKLHVDAWVFETDAGARAQTIQQTYLKEIDAADLYIGIFWKGYGQYTVDEFDHARNVGKSCLVYEKRSALEDRDSRLAEFLDRIGTVETGLTIRRFETPDQLGEFVKQDVAAWQADIVRTVQTRDFAPPFQVPALGDQYIERTSLMNSLCEKLTAVKENGLPVVTRAALHGIGGLGKTTTAAAFAHLQAVRKRFSDGVLWITLGQSPDVRQRISDWGRALRDREMTPVGYADTNAGTNQLRALLADKTCLLIVDDVWQAAHVRPFLVGGPRCLLVITTRISEVGQEIGALTIELSEMTPVEASALVEKWSGALGDQEREQAEWLMREVGYLPLALELIGAQVTKLGGWDEYRRRWDRQKLKAIKRGRITRGREDNLWDSLDLSVEALPVEDQARYIALGVFTEDALFPPLACAALWACAEEDAAELLVDLAGRAMLRERKEFRPRRYNLHDLFYEFVVERLGSEGRNRAHTMLVEGYRGLCPGGWHTGPDDGYFFGHLAHHLAAAGLTGELYNLIDKSWLEAQFRRSYSHAAFASDLEKAIAAASAETPPNVFQLVRATFARATLGSLASRSDVETLAALARIGQPEMACGHAELIQDPARRSRAYRLIAEALLARGETADARRQLQDARLAASNVESEYFRSIALGEIVQTLMAAGQPELALRVADDCEAAARAETNERFKPALLIESARAHAAAGNIRQSDVVAEAALNVLEYEEVRPDRLRKMAQLMRLETAFSKTGNTERAREMEARAGALFDEINGLIGTGGYIYLGYSEDVSDAFLEAGHPDSAAIIAERWSERDWDRVGALARTATALVSAKELEQARRIADQCTEFVHELLIAPQYQFQRVKRTDGLGALAGALVRVGRGEDAIRMADSVADPEARTRALGAAAYALAEGDQIEAAQRAAEASLATSYRLTGSDVQQVQWLTAVAGALCRTGKKADAVETANRAVRLAADWECEHWQKEKHMLALVETFTESGEWAKAISVIESFSDGSKKAEALIRVARSRIDDPNQARTLLNRAEELVRHLKDAARVSVLGAAANGFADVGLEAEAVRMAWLTVAAADAIEDPHSGPEDGLCEAAQALSRVRQFDPARQVAERISKERDQGLARTLGKRVRALAALAEALEDTGQHDAAVANARAALDSAVEAAHDETDANAFSSEALTVASRVLTRVGDRENAELAGFRALQIAVDRLDGRRA